MSDGLEALTDKEKEALRLLLAGHDAKSSAAELDLSVHTINDRLRNARRKLQVSSSREAARILGDSEGATPQNPAREPFGIAQTEDRDHSPNQSGTGRKGAFRINWLAGGMLIMSLLIAAAVVASSMMSGTTAIEEHPQETATMETAAEQPASLLRAERFLEAVDAGDWRESWNRTGPYFQSQASAVQWEAQVEPVREPLGAIEERQLASVQRASSLPGAPEGEYEVLQFQTDFAGREGLALETVIMIAGEDGWEVVGYFIR